MISELFEKSNDIQPLKPSEALGASTSELGNRYRGLDAGLRGALLHDMKAEDKKLKHYMDKCRLGKWFEGTLDLAKRNVQAEAAEELESSEAMQGAAKMLADIEDDLAEKQKADALKALKSKPRIRRVKMNGSASMGRLGASGMSIIN
jgi:hypothetical protein